MVFPEIVQQLYGKWQELLNRNEGQALRKLICIDGKTMRSNKRKDGKGSHIISAWSREDGFCLGQKAVGEKSNEITAIPELLDRQAAQNQNIIQKWSLSILKMVELLKPGLSMKKKRFAISLRPIKYLEEVLSF